MVCFELSHCRIFSGLSPFGSGSVLPPLCSNTSILTQLQCVWKVIVLSHPLVFLKVRKVMCVVPTVNDMVSVFLTKLLYLSGSVANLSCGAFMLSSSRPGLALPCLFSFCLLVLEACFPATGLLKPCGSPFSLSLQLDLEHFLSLYYIPTTS